MNIECLIGNHTWSYDSRNSEYCIHCGKKSGLARMLVISKEMYQDTSIQILESEFPELFNILFADSPTDSRQISLPLSPSSAGSIRFFRITEAAYCRYWLDMRQLEDSGSYYIAFRDGKLIEVPDGFYYQGVHFMGQTIGSVVEKYLISDILAFLEFVPKDPYKLTIVLISDVIRKFVEQCFIE